MGLRKISLLAVVCFGLLVSSNHVEQELEQERRPIKTFKTIYGEIIDCIDIYKQPAFNHPLLKDHKLQVLIYWQNCKDNCTIDPILSYTCTKQPLLAPPPLFNSGDTVLHETLPKKPSFSLNAKKHRHIAQAKQLEISHVLDGCPDGTIPILRTTKEDRMRAKLLEQTRPQIYHPSSTDSPGYHFAYMELFFAPRDPFHGAKAFIDNYIPKCENGQSSGAQIWIFNNLNNQTNSIQAGWRVDPDLYNDDRSHFFTYWKGPDGAGCFDLQCPGFVQVDHSITLGGALPSSSVYDGPQFEIHLAIRQDLTTKNWWLTFENNNVDVNVGYWPANFLPQLLFGANTVQYGGVTHTSQGKPFPPMGSGYFPDHSYKHACYFRQIQYMNDSQTWKVPVSWQTSAHTSSEECYRAATNDDDKFMGYTLLFGGPGGDGCGV